MKKEFATSSLYELSQMRREETSSMLDRTLLHVGHVRQEVVIADRKLTY